MSEPSADLNGGPPGGLWEAAREWWARLRRRVLGPPPEMTEADLVPPGAEPICPTCIEPHHPLLSRCPNCGEYVGAYNTLLYLDWVYIWGRGMQDLAWQRPLTRLLRAGMIVLAVQYGVEAASSWWGCAAVLFGKGLSGFPAEVTSLLPREVSFIETAFFGVVYTLVSVGLVRALRRPRPDGGEEEPQEIEE